MIVGSDLQVAPNHPYAKELVKWEAHYTQYGPPGRPYVHQDYPARLYRPFRPAQGGPAQFEGQTAADEREREQLERAGFVFGGQGEALKALEAREFEMAELAANRVIPEQRMSEKARAEADAVDMSTIQHLGEIPAANPKSGRRGDLR